ncbi:Serine/threonine protein kinase [Handroanthus impetiginosus]|uniref:non-specific serine/threonine protein kinase n=1 Tax=Handroanthus impetiginosus TaxID=429701 RepID=A0A2G9FW48_9LAMI|nr:Serine/threonine protein kinase [Handroanthus impetiginosus]
MAIFHSVGTFLSPLLALFVISLFPFIHSLSTVAISETANQTLICAMAKSVNSSQDSSIVLRCRGFPQGNEIPFNPFNPRLRLVSGVVGGNGFMCGLSSIYSSSRSVIVCWRFSNLGDYISYKRIYKGPILTELESGNSHFCGLVNGSSSLRCWQWQGFNYSLNNVSSNLAVGENFVCGLSSSGQVNCSGDDTNVVHRVPGGSFRLVEAGFRHACAVSLNGSLECWGSMGGNKPIGEFTSPALGEDRSCAIRPNGTVSCWGKNGFTLPQSLRNEYFMALEAKRRVFCGVLTSNSSLFCWGNKYFDANPLVFDHVVPGPCRTGNECDCGPLPNYGEYCPQGQMICQTCTKNPGSPAPSPLSPPPAPRPPRPPLSSPSPSPPPIPRATSSKKWTTKMVAFFVVGCVGSFSLLLVLCIFLFSRYINIKGSRVHDSGRLEEEDPPHDSVQTSQSQPAPVLEKKLSHLISLGSGGHLEEFSLEVLIKATENFSEDHKIGNGSFGSVYHATLDDGRHVAIKRAEISGSSSYAAPTKRGQDDKESAFLTELEFLSRLNHKNLVRLFGYCEDSNERVLVYEYMDNGTLFDHLHKLEDSPLMSWATRIKVALDAARGIEYLHEYAVPRIIHRDIKSSNILLDATWTAKVSDFGLSLMGPEDDESHLSLRAAGTMGYMDPEYYRLQVLTTKSDVYSFGIVLLELLSGFKAIHKNENGVPRNVVDYVVPYTVKDEIHRVLDKRMPPPTPFEIEAVAYVGYLAADCVMLEGKDRPTMSEVVNSLDRALEACLVPPVLSRSTTDSSTHS